MTKLSTAFLTILLAHAARGTELFSGRLPPLPADQVVAIDEVTEGRPVFTLVGD
jgi:hypothetical protein